jgi:para-nitrobenzyl esterase
LTLHEPSPTQYFPIPSDMLETLEEPCLQDTSASDVKEPRKRRKPVDSDTLSAFAQEAMKTVNRRTVLRYSGVAAATFTLRKGIWALSEGGSAAIDAAGAAPVAKTAYGSISGTLEDGINVFRGVPYGADAAPVRFQAPLPPSPWTGLKVCDTFTTRAPQLMALRGPQGVNAAPSLGPAGVSPAGAPPRVAPEAGVQSEDCLHLNVFTPALRDHRKRPVLVYFHGGAYNNGSVNSPLYDGKRLCHRGDVVVVTVNHRLNAFGFMFLAGIDPKQYADSETSACSTSFSRSSGYVRISPSSAATLPGF